MMPTPGGAAGMPQPSHPSYPPGAYSTPYPNYDQADGASAGMYPQYPHYSAPYPSGASQGPLFGLPPGGNISMNSVGMGAVFKKRVERIDWRKLAALDVDRISREMDVQSLQDNLMNITFCNLESEVDCRNMDPNFVKLFKVAQLSIEYMLYSQEYLANVMAGLESRLSQVVLDHESTRKELNKQKDELVAVKKESHKRKKLLAAQQQILHSGAQSYHKCPFCPKAFVHESYCVAHIQRRHADEAAASGFAQSSSVSQPGAGHVSSSVQSHQQIHQELIEVKSRLKYTERQLQSERQQGGGADLDEQRAMMEEWKAREQEKHREEYEALRQMFLNQFEELNHKYLESEDQLMKLRGKNEQNNLPGTVSNLGELADDTDTETDRSRATRASLRRILSPEKSLKDQMDTQTFDIEKRNQEEIARLDAVLKSSRPGVSPPVSQPNTPKVKGVTEDVMTSSVAATAASANVELPLVAKHSDLNKTAPPSSFAQKRSFSPDGSPVLSPRAGSPAKKQREHLGPGQRAVYDRSDDDIDDEESELQEVNQEFVMWTNEEALKSTLGSTGGPGEEPLGTEESLIGTAIRRSRLNEQLSKDPGLLKGLRVELEQVLDEQLEEKGITRDLNGISNVVLNNKLEAMEKDREIMDRKYSNFLAIRRQYERKVNREALIKWEKIKEQQKKEKKKKAVKSSKSSSLPNLASPRLQSPSLSPALRSPAKKPQVPQSPRSPVVIKKESPSTPQAPPRTSTTLSTEYSTGQETADDDEYTESEETDGLDEVDTPQPPKLEPSAPRIIMSGPPAPPPRSPEEPATPKTPRDEVSEWDSTEMSSEVKPTVRSNVKSLSQTVDSQLKGRTAADRPFGGVNTVSGVPARQSAERHVRIEVPDDDDDDFSVSSLQDLTKPQPAPAPRKPVRTSADGEVSTNTGGTSVWGSVSRAPGGGVGKSSQSFTDFDSDLDDLDDI